MLGDAQSARVVGLMVSTPGIDSRPVPGPRPTAISCANSVATTSQITEFKPTDATTNPSLCNAAARLPEYRHLVDDAIRYASKFEGQEKKEVLLDEDAEDEEEEMEDAISDEPIKHLGVV